MVSFYQLFTLKRPEKKLLRLLKSLPVPLKINRIETNRKVLYAFGGGGGGRIRQRDFMHQN